MLQTLRNAWKIPELRQKIIFTLFILLIYRVGNVIPVPFIDVGTLANYFDSVLSNTILGLYNAMSGSAFSQATVFFRDIQYIYNAVTTAWLYLTPIFYPIESLPDNVLLFVKHCNPMYFYVGQFRDLMYAGRIGGLSLMLIVGERLRAPATERPTENILVG